MERERLRETGAREEGVLEEGIEMGEAKTPLCIRCTAPSEVRGHFGRWFTYVLVNHRII